MSTKLPQNEERRTKNDEPVFANYVDQALGWHDAARFSPENPRCVLAHDNEAHFIAVYENDLWYNAHLDEPIDSVIIGWQELPEIPDGL